MGAGANGRPFGSGDSLDNLVGGKKPARDQGGLVKGPYGTYASNSVNYGNQANVGYQAVQNLINNSKDLGQGNKDKWTSEFLNLSSQQKDPRTFLGTVAGFKQRIADLPKDVLNQQTYINEQYNVMQNQVNAKLQQNRITSFLGSTAVRGALARV